MAPPISAHRTVFRHFPGLLLLSLVIECGILGILLAAIVTDPTVFTPKGLLLAALFVIGAYLVGVVVWMLWITSSALIITDSHLVAVNRPLRWRVSVAWDTISSVRKVERAWWNRIGGELALNEIHTRDGRRLMFGTHLFWYGEFLEVLKERAQQCEQFDPHPRGIGERGPAQQSTL
jgi:hypothetical protein